MKMRENNENYGSSLKDSPHLRDHCIHMRVYTSLYVLPPLTPSLAHCKSLYKFVDRISKHCW